jgi:hypothetical protein
MGRANTAFFDGKIAEAVVYNADQTDANLALYRQYLESRYALGAGALA